MGRSDAEQVMFCDKVAKVMPPSACDVAHSVRSDVLCAHKVDESGRLSVFAAQKSEAAEYRLPILFSLIIALIIGEADTSPDKVGRSVASQTMFLLTQK